MNYKVGDRVRVKSLDWYNENKTIHGDIWFDNAVFVGGQSLYCGFELTIRLVTDDSYYVIENDYYWTDEMIEGLVEEENEKKLSDESWRYKNIFDSSQYPQSFECPEGYIFKDENGNVINATKIVLEKKKKEYPKTYEECCKVLGIPIHGGIALVGNWCMEDGYIVQHLETLRALSKLLICRDAYWKIAGEEMGLGKDLPWEPDWSDASCSKYIIDCFGGEICKGITAKQNTTFAFPTEEMRDAFKENFDPDIEFCKELL